MKEIILVKYGEIILKGGNRRRFEQLLLQNIRNSIKDAADAKLKLMQAAIYIEPAEADKTDIIVERLKKVFGIVSITRAAVCEKSLDAIIETAAEYCREELSADVSFKVETKRADKSFPLTSIETSQHVGGEIQDRFPQLRVDVHNPDITLRVEIREGTACVYIEEKRIAGQGGIPIGASSRALLLLSGGIDSPVAGHMIAKRGVMIDAVNFFSFPYTSERAKEKVIELAKILSEYTMGMRLFIVPFTEIQLAIRDKCPEEYLTVIMRRFMMRIAERIARENKSQALVTGESVGQVASQTIAALDNTNTVVDMPVLRPLIGMDKIEIVERSERIGTYDTSILPYEDCCTVFTPRHPSVNPRRANIEKSETHLDIEGLIENALRGVETIEIYPREDI